MAAVSGSRRLNLLVMVWFGWFVVYVASGVLFGIPFLTGTADRVESRVIALIFLNIPVQLLLVLGAAGSLRSTNGGVVRLGTGLAVVALSLASVHLMISLVTLR